MGNEDNNSMRDRQIDTIISRLATCVDRIGELHARMATLIEIQTQQTTRLDKLEDRLEDKIDKLGGRIGQLEKWLWRCTGFGGAMMAAFELAKYAK